jgi:hypothetical protein
VRTYISAGVVDMHEIPDGMAGVTQALLQGDLVSGHLVVFCSRRQGRLSILSSSLVVPRLPVPSQALGARHPLIARSGADHEPEDDARQGDYASSLTKPDGLAPRRYAIVALASVVQMARCTTNG